MSTAPRRTVSLDPLGTPRVAAVIPTLNEGETLPGVLREFPAGIVDEVIVVDGGSQDGTVQAAEQAGARVVEEARRGYGRACAAGAAATDSEVIVFLDGDGSDDPGAAARRAATDPRRRRGARARCAPPPEPGALELHQRLGNGLVALLVRSIYGVPVHDVPPMRAIRRDALTELELREMTYGWPTEMLVKAARAGLPIVEVDVPCRARRGGESKIAGRAGPSAKAGARMLAVVATVRLTRTGRLDEDSRGQLRGATPSHEVDRSMQIHVRSQCQLVGEADREAGRSSTSQRHSKTRSASVSTRLTARSTSIAAMCDWTHRHVRLRSLKGPPRAGPFRNAD